MEELIELYKQTVKTDNFRVDKSLLKKHKFSEMQWVSFVNLVEELDLNDDGIRIMLDEIRAGRVVLT